MGTPEAAKADAAALDAMAVDATAASEAGGAVEAGSAEGGSSPDAPATSPDVVGADRATDSAVSNDVPVSVGDTTGAGGVGSDVSMSGGAGGTGGVLGSGGGGGSAGGSGADGAGPAQLALLMIANPDPAVPLGLINYEIRVSNQGAGTATNVVLTEQTQNGANAIVSTISNGGACSNTAACAPGVIITWPAFSLAPGQVQTITFTSQVLNGTANGTNVHNTATLTFPGGTLMQSRDVLVDAAQALSVRLAADHDPVKPGDLTTYTVMVGNSGTQSLPLSAAGILSANVPTGTTFVSAEGGGALSGSTVQWSLGSLDAGATRRYTYTVTVDGGLGDGTVLQATSQILDGAASLARAAANTTVNGQSALKLTLIANPDPAAPLGLVDYRIRLSNTGDSTLTNVVLKEATQNSASTLVSAISGGGACSNTAACGPGVVITWPAFTLAPGQTQTILFTNQIANGTADGTLVHNAASVTYAGGGVMQAMDLAVSSAQGLRLAIDEDHDPVSPGDSLTYAVVVGNTGSRSLPLSSAGVLTATIPPGTTFVSGSAGATFSDGLVKWSIGAVDAGANQHYTFTVTVGSGLHGGAVLPALAQVMDGDASVVRAASATVVDATSPLRLTMVANPDPAASLGLVVYKVMVRNTSGSTLTNVVLSEATQNSASTLVGTIAGGGACSNTAACGPGVVITWPALTLAPGQTQTILFTNQVANGTVDGTLIHNVAMVTHPGGAVSQGLTVAVDSSAGLRLAIAEDHDPVHPSDTLTYTIEAGNTGSQGLPLSATGILTATVPLGTTFVSASAGGTASGGLVQWTVGAVDAGASRRYTYTVAVSATLGDGAVLLSTAQLLDGSQSLVRAEAATEVKAASPLKLVMTANPDPAAPLSLVNYEVKVSNTSTSSLTNVVFTESTQNSASTLVGTIVGGGACSNTAACGPGVIVTWPALTLSPGQTQTLSFTNQVANGTLNGTLIHNTATVTYPSGSVSQGLDLVVSNTPSLRLAIAEDHDPVAPGDAITYTVVAGNPGSQSLPLSAAGILTATVPQGTTFVSATDGGTLNGGLVQWSVGAIDAGASKHYTYTVMAGGTLGDGATLLAFAQLMDGATSLVRSAASTDVKAASPLTLTMTVSPDPAAPLGLVDYVLVATNTGTSSLTNLVMRDAIQNNASIIVADITGGGSCSNTAACGPGVIVTWPAFTLTAGQAQTLSFTAQIANGTVDGTLIHNGATLTYPSGTVSQGYDLVVHH